MRRKGLGKFLIQILQLIANRCTYGCDWVMCRRGILKDMFFIGTCQIKAIASPSLSNLNKIVPVFAVALPGVSPRGRQRAPRFANCIKSNAKFKCLFCLFCSTQMKKVMLTVFKHNHGAYQFFREALQ